MPDLSTATRNLSIAYLKGKQQSFLLSLHHPLVWINNVTSDHFEIPRAVPLADSGRGVAIAMMVTPSQYPAVT